MTRKLILKVKKFHSSSTKGFGTVDEKPCRVHVSSGVDFFSTVEFELVNSMAKALGL